MTSDAIFDLLQACLKQKNLTDARHIYRRAVGTGLDSSTLFRDHLIRLLAHCGSLLDANRVFRSSAKRSTYTWNAIIAAHVNHGEFEAALSLYSRMKEEGALPNRVTYLSLLKSCACLNDLDQGLLFHKEINATKYKSDIVLGNSLIDIYAKLRSLHEARDVFDSMPVRDVVSWGSMIDGYTQNGQSVSALELFRQMQLEEVKPDRAVFASALKASAQIGALEEGRFIHEEIVRSGQDYSSDLVVGNTLVDMYGKCGSMEDAQVVFNGLPSQDVVSWDVLISGYSKNGYKDVVFNLSDKMHLQRVTPAKATFLCLLKACGFSGSSYRGRIFHDEILKCDNTNDLELGNTLVDMYAKCGNLHDAQRVFDLLRTPSVVSWNALILGYANHGCEHAVLDLFERMLEEGITPTEVVISSAVKACGSLRDLDHGKLIHRRITENSLPADRVVQNALLDMYVKCGNINESEKAFDEIFTKDVVSWGAIIAGNAQHGQSLHALELFEMMQQQGIKPNDVLFPSVLKAIGDLGMTRMGMVIHDQVLDSGCDSNVVVGNSLIDMYGKCAYLDEARKVFESLQCRDVVSSASMVAAYVEHGYGFHALDVYARMHELGMEASKVVFLHVVKACGMVGAIEYNRLVHSQVVEAELQSDVTIANTFIDMYAKSDSIEDAQGVFNALGCRNAVTWASMITGYANCGNLSVAWHLLEEMRRHGLQPDDEVFSKILSACSNFGLLKEGQLYFARMRDTFGKMPSLEHYSCIIDLLARAGSLAEAGELVSTLPVSPDAVVWRSLLANSKTYENQDVARHSYLGIWEQGSIDTSGLVLISRFCVEDQLGWFKGGNQEYEFAVGGEYDEDHDNSCITLHNSDTQSSDEQHMGLSSEATPGIMNLKAMGASVKGISRPIESIYGSYESHTLKNTFIPLNHSHITSKQGNLEMRTFTLFYDGLFSMC